MIDNLCLVQFPHPKPEHKPDRDNDKLKSWNRGPHRRKFLKSSGRFIDLDDKEQSGEFVFWGEWEPDSDVIRKYESPNTGYPQFLYKPFYKKSTILNNINTANFSCNTDCARPKKTNLQNTDPFVFGEKFYYTFCRQPTKPALRSLCPGSLIIFGSCIKPHFVLDTVFVVSDYVDHSKNTWETQLNWIDDTYRDVTIKPMYNENMPDNRIHRLYKGATFQKPLNGMFSFFPCQTYHEYDQGFLRPSVAISGEKPNQPGKIMINPDSSRNVSITYGLTPNEINKIWNSVVKQVRSQKLMLGTYAQIPPRE